MVNGRLTTDRLVLIPLRLRDAGFVYRLVSDPRVRAYLGNVAPLPHRLWRLPQYWKGDAVWLVRVFDTHQPIGLVALSPHRDDRTIELSYQFVAKAWCQGFGTEAARAALDYAFERLECAQVIAETQSANTASCRVLSKLGMTKQCRLTRFNAQQVIFALAR